MSYGQPNYFKSAGDLFSHLPKHRARGRMPLVGQRPHLPSMVDAPHIAAKSNYGAGGLVCHQLLHRAHVQGLLGNLDKPDGIHDTIIKGFPVRRCMGYEKVALCEKY